MTNPILTLDRWVLARGDAIIHWVWDELGVPRRMILRMILFLMVATAFASDLQETGRIDGVNLASCGVILALFHSGDIWFRRSPELERAITAARRSTGLSVASRFFVWAIAAYGLFADRQSMSVASDLLFWLFMIGSDTLTPSGPRRRRATFIRRADVRT